MARRVYSEEEVATALAFVKANNGDIRKVAARLKMPHVTLWKWVRNETKAHALGTPKGDAIASKEQEKKKTLADLFEDEAHAALLAAGEVRDTATYNFLMTGAAIAVDKMRLLREQPTEIVKDAGTPEEKLAAIQKALDQRGLPGLRVIEGGKTGTDG